MRDLPRERGCYERHLAGETYRQIGETMGVTGVRVDQLIHKYLRHLRRYSDGTETFCPGCGSPIVADGWRKGECSNRRWCGYHLPSNTGFHADRAGGPDNSEHSSETRPAGEPNR
jgi:hypothetical protein